MTTHPHMTTQQALNEILRTSHEALTTISLNHTKEMELMVEAMRQIHTIANTVLTNQARPRWKYEREVRV